MKVILTFQEIHELLAEKLNVTPDKFELLIVKGDESGKIIPFPVVEHPEDK